jgi:hypothetical protein
MNYVHLHFRHRHRKLSTSWCDDKSRIAFFSAFTLWHLKCCPSHPSSGHSCGSAYLSGTTLGNRTWTRTILPPALSLLHHHILNSHAHSHESSSRLASTSAFSRVCTSPAACASCSVLSSRPIRGPGSNPNSAINSPPVSNGGGATVSS